MNCSITCSLVGSLAAVAALTTTLAFAQSTTSPNAPKRPAAPATPTAPAKPQAPADGGHGEMPLPPGLTMDDMMAMQAAGQPGDMHAHLAKSAGVWQGTVTFWMTPEASPETMACTTTIAPIMGGRWMQASTEGEMAGMGPFSGMGLNGFDNISKKFQAMWIDNMSTGMMSGTGELSKDGKVLTWTMNCNCPITGKPMVMREVDTTTGPDSMKLEMFATWPKTGKEYKSMEIVYTRKPGTGPKTAIGTATEGKAQN